MHTYTYTHTYTHSYTLSHTYIYKHKYIYARTHTHTHIYIYTHTQEHTHTHTHTHIYIYIYIYIVLIQALNTLKHIHAPLLNIEIFQLKTPIYYAKKTPKNQKTKKPNKQKWQILKGHYTKINKPCLHKIDFEYRRGVLKRLKQLSASILSLICYNVLFRKFFS